MQEIGETENNTAMAGFGTLLQNTVHTIIGEMNALEKNREDLHRQLGPAYGLDMAILLARFPNNPPSARRVGFGWSAGPSRIAFKLSCRHSRNRLHLAGFIAGGVQFGKCRAIRRFCRAGIFQLPLRLQFPE